MNKISGLIGALLCLICFSSVSAQVSSGGAYTLNRTVVANGGGTSTDTVNNNYKIEGTSGQTSAGTTVSSGSYSLLDGFWTPSSLSPTAAGASLSGRVVGQGKRGLSNVIVVLSGGNLAAPRTVRTGSFGHFMFEDVEVGQIYVISVQNRKYSFAPDSQIVSVFDNVNDIVFQAVGEN